MSTRRGIAYASLKRPAKRMWPSIYLYGQPPWTEVRGLKE